MFSSSPFDTEFEKLYLVSDKKDFNNLEGCEVLLLKESINSVEFASLYIEAIKKLLRVKQNNRALEVIESEDIEAINKESGFSFTADIIFENGESTFPLSQLSREFLKLELFRVVETEKQSIDKQFNSATIENLLKRVEELEKRVETLEKQRDSSQKRAIGKVSDDREAVISGRTKTTVWKDIETNLYWEVKNSKNRDESFSYEDALLYIEELNSEKFGGFNNWRVPTKAELQTLFSREKESELYIKKPLSKNVVTKFKPLYWSSTESEDEPMFIWVAHFNHGYGDYKYRTHNYYLRAVRG